MAGTKDSLTRDYFRLRDDHGAGFGSIVKDCQNVVKGLSGIFTGFCLMAAGKAANMPQALLGCYSNFTFLTEPHIR